MASVTTNTHPRTAAVRTDILGGIGATLAGLRARWAAYTLYRRTRDELMQLSERELNDIGLNRGMVESIARQAAGYAD